MKRITILILVSVILFASCSVKKEGETYNTFYHDDFSFKYPKNWEILENSDLVKFNENSIVMLSPKRSIKKIYSTYQNNISESEYTTSYVMVEIVFNSKDTYLKKNVNPIDNKYFKNIKEVNVNHNYSIKTFEQKPLFIKGVREIKQIFKLHCITTSEKKYSILIVLNKEFQKAYQDDVQFIENSFSFKNSETQDMFRPFP